MAVASQSSSQLCQEPSHKDGDDDDGAGGYDDDAAG